MFAKARQRGTVIVNGLQAFGRGGAQPVCHVNLPKLDIKVVAKAVRGGEELRGGMF